MSILSFIIWSPNPEIFPGISWLPVRWYGLLFAMSFIVGQQIYLYIYKKEGKPEKDVETLTIYLVIATIIGARLGHVLFYEPIRFLSEPLEILKIWKGGLASHGAAIGVLLGIYIYSNYLVRISFSEFKIKKRKKEGQGFLYVMDRVMIVAALSGAFIRAGNFMNSEIIGIPTQSNFGVLFARDIVERFEYDQLIEKVEVENYTSENVTNKPKGYQPIDLILTFSSDINDENIVRRYVETHARHILANYEYIKLHVFQPESEKIKYEVLKSKDGLLLEAHIHTLGITRHPAQLYEAISCFLLFWLLLWIWSRRKALTPNGLIFGVFLIILFTFRFFYEFFKENQVDFENDIPLNMGQWLSIPFIIAGIFILIKALRSDEANK